MSNPARIRWSLRRGMKELDVLMERYYAKRYAIAPDAERQAFAALLQQEDPEIWAWVMGYAEPPTEFADVVARLRSHH